MLDSLISTHLLFIIARPGRLKAPVEDAKCGFQFIKQKPLDRSPTSFVSLERACPSPCSLRYRTDKEMDVWYGTSHLPSCVDGTGLIPFSLYLRSVREKAQTWKELPIVFHRTVPLALRHLLGYGSHVCLRKGHMGVQRSNDVSVCTPVVYGFTVYRVNCKMKTCPSILRQLEGKDSTWVSDKGGYHPISALVRHLVWSKVAKCIMAVPGWSQARGGDGGRR